MDGSQGGGSLEEALAAEAEKARLEVHAAQTRFLRDGVTDATAVGVAATISIAAMLPVAQPVLAAAVGVAITPFVIAILVLGFTRIAVPFATLALFSLTALLGAYALLLESRLTGHEPLSLIWTTVLFGTAMVPQFVGLFAARMTPSDERGLPPLPCAAIGLVSVVTILLLTSIAFAGFLVPPMAIDPALMASLYAAALFPPVIASWAQARREKRLPVKPGDRQPDHISGLGATGLILFTAIIVVLGLWAAATGVNAQISIYAGLIVLGGLVIAFGFVAFGAPVSRRLSPAFQALKTFVKPVGWLFSFIDSLMVFAVANALGANESRWELRYALLLGSLLPCGALGWWLPAPYGLIPLSFALLGTIAMARRWAWVEEDRENAMLAGRFEGNHIRVGFTQDLKDEALAGFAALFVIVPIALRQLHQALGGDVFEIKNPSDVDSLVAWLSFFGTELAKAVPFVDWAEIYQVEGDAIITLDETKIGVGQHVVFATRILVDLVLLAAFLQAITISQRTRKLKDMFYVNHSLNRLDPFIEPHEFRKLVRTTAAGFEPIEDKLRDFPVYDPERLEELKHRKEKDEIAFAADCLLNRDAGHGPEENLSKEARRDAPDRNRCMDFLDRVRELSKVNVGHLKTAHYALRRKAPFVPVRLEVVGQIARALPNDQAVNAINEILNGPGASALSPQDPRQEVRLAALRVLFPVALAGNMVCRSAIRFAATNDPAQAVRTAAKEMLEFSSDW